MSMQETPYTYPVNKVRRPYRTGLFTFLFVILLALATGLIQIHLYDVYQTYQQGSCTIESGKTDYYSGKYSHYYTPDFQYIVHTSDGQQANVSGYDAPYNEQYDTQQEAQNVVDSYNVGQAYSCWYNPTDPTHAVLVYYGYNNFTLLANYAGTALVAFLGYTFLWFLLYYTFYRQLCLMRRGVVVEGRVASTFQRNSRYGKKTYSCVLYSPVDDPSQTYKLEIPGDHTIGMLHPVCYDPRNPKNRQSGQRPGSGCATFALIGFIVSALLTALILLGVWYGA